MRVNEEMRGRRAIIEFKNELREYINGEIAQRMGYIESGPITFLGK